MDRKLKKISDVVEIENGKRKNKQLAPSADGTT